MEAVARGTAPEAEMAPAAVKGLLGDGLAPAELTASAPAERWEVAPVSTEYAKSRDAMLAHIEKLLLELESH